ncbi:hypothetical protein Verru16b_02467 [Lacunisphaera limnophila]|uniref:Putative zinc-finger domain-containing protein n=1 Tax=Lacunisphaera limnophila TaxID=1838286 RepID=A0A1D8AWZ2_9BACT|nr:zf-HC2 domain-containing protein [Lacunisphaera limnophila]AOS45386.1 hypothetical protein Verru16b_02467 [Lacunisphaera limnophila]
MNCRDNESLILAERDGTLSPAQLAALSDHVAACPACRELRQRVGAALEAYRAEVATAPVTDADEAWRDLQTRLARPGRPRPLAPVIWFGVSLAAAAALALAVFYQRPPDSSSPSTEFVNVPPPPPLHDPSVIAGADFVEAGDPNASTLVYVDKESGWLVVWASDPETATKG